MRDLTAFSAIMTKDPYLSLAVAFLASPWSCQIFRHHGLRRLSYNPTLMKPDEAFHSLC